MVTRVSTPSMSGKDVEVVSATSIVFASSLIEEKS
jgi:hypothetical protein